MAVTKKGMGITVLEAAYSRLKQIFSNGVKVYLDVSGGKDSIVMMGLVYNLIQQGDINPKQLEVVFIDEEVIYDDVLRVCKEWRTKFMLVGAKYSWYTIEHRNNNCFNSLENNENFIPWDRYEKDNWAHEKPKFAISNSPFLVPRIENYQDFLRRMQSDGIAIIGVRASESLNRLKYISVINAQKCAITGGNVMYPIYDWKDSDIWKFIKDERLDFPDVYLRMYESGVKKNRLRVCNLFSIDTCASLVNMFEVYPGLWESIVKREPNAYLVRLYWDSEMFHRSTQSKRKLERENNIVDTKDYKKELMNVFHNPNVYFRNKHALKMCEEYRRFVIRNNVMLSICPDYYKKLYLGLMGGDTKGRTIRALTTGLYIDYNTKMGTHVPTISKV